MINSNEFPLAKAMIDKGISPKIVRELMTFFAGWRIYIREKESEYSEIRETYKQMIDAGYTKSDAIKHLSFYFDKCEQRISIIVQKQGELFEV